VALTAAVAGVLALLYAAGPLRPLLLPRLAPGALLVITFIALVLLGACAYALRVVRHERSRARQLELELAARANEDLERSHRILRLEQELQTVRTHHGLLAMCSWCKSIRDGSGEWSALEPYLERYLHAAFTHGVCPECMRVEYPGLFDQTS
jgi:hypothetical protein